MAEIVRELGESEEQELQALVEHYLSLARGGEKPEDDAKRWRNWIALKPYRKKPKGAKDIVTPIIRQKADGVRAHVLAATDQRPLYTVTAYDPVAQSVSAELEDLMQTTIEVTDSRRAILNAVRDAVEVGTGILKHVLVEDREGRKVPASRYVPFEDIYVYPSYAARPEHYSFFERYQEPLYEMEAKAERGVYWPDRVAKLLEGADEVERLSVKEVWEVWIRFKGAWYEVRYSEEVGILAYRRSEWAELLGRAPYDPIYIEPSQLSFWGDSIAQILAPLQRIADEAINLELMRGEITMNPPTFVVQGSPLMRQIKSSGNRLLPGRVYEVTDPQNDIVIPSFGMNPVNLQLIQVVEKLAEEATISDMLVPGQALGGRKTATEVNIISTVGALKLRNYLSSVADGLERHGRAKWALVATYVLQAPHLAHTSLFTWRLNGRETVPEQQTRLSQIQYILNPQFLELARLSLQDPFLREVIAAFLSYLDLPGLGALYRRMAYGSHTGLGVQAAAGQLPQAGGLLAGGAPAQPVPEAGAQ